jgi:hypothetical protein
VPISFASLFTISAREFWGSGCVANLTEIGPCGHPYSITTLYKTLASGLNACGKTNRMVAPAGNWYPGTAGLEDLSNLNQGSNWCPAAGTVLIMGW